MSYNNNIIKNEILTKMVGKKKKKKKKKRKCKNELFNAYPAMGNFFRHQTDDIFLSFSSP